MRSWMLAAAALAALGGVGAAYAQDVIADRRDGLKGMAAQMEAIKGVVDAGSDPRAVVPRIDTMITFFEGLPARFPAGSDSGNTRALPTVWSDRAGFETAAQNMVTQLRALRSTADAGDAAGMGAAFRQTGATCGACHRNYRGRS